MSEKHCPDLLAGYALGALDPAEREEATAHLAECPDCRSEEANLAEALHATLGHDCPPATPSPLLRTQFLARVALEMTPGEAASMPARPAPSVAPIIVNSQPPPQAPPTLAVARQGFVPRWAMAAIAVPTIAALALVFGLMNMKQQYDNQSNHLLGQALAAPHVAMLLNGPGVHHGMNGEVIVPKSGSGGLLILSGMTKAPGNMAYTCWVKKNGQWTAWAPLRPDASGIAMFVMDRSMDPHSANAMAITLEHQDRASQTPSGPMLLTTQL
jgi:hypothetical protein